MKKKSLVLLLSLLLIFAFAIPVVADSTFTDVSDIDWFAPYVYDLVDSGILSGYSDGTFQPQKTITRGEFVKILAFASGDDLTAYTGDLPFADAQSHWSKTNILWAYENGIVNGKSETSFDPNGKITRQEMAVMIYRYADYKNIELPKKADPIAFNDSIEIANWAKDAVAAMQQAQIINGYDDKTFRPLKNATRAEASKMISTYEDIDENNPPIEDDPVEDDSEIIATGQCGDEAYWKLDDAGTLTIYGSGRTWNSGDTEYEWVPSYFSYVDINDGVENENDEDWYDNYIKKGVVEEGITNLGDDIFSYMRELETVELPSSLEKVHYYKNMNTGRGSSFNSPNLENIFINSGNSFFCDVDGVLFSKDKKTLVCYPSGKDTINIPDSIVEIYDFALEGNEKIERYDASNISNIGVGAFKGCKNLKTVLLSDKLECIKEQTFSGCEDLISITIPNSATFISPYALLGIGSGLTIYGYSGSTAENYAKENDIPFSVIR